MNPKTDTQPTATAGAVSSGDLFGSAVWTAADLLENAYLSDIERWWEAWKDGKHHQFVRVRLDIQKQEYVLDAVGQELRHSEELWRYKHGGWTFRSALPNMPSETRRGQRHD